MSRAELIKEIEPEDYALVRMTEHDLIEVVEIEESCGLSLWGWDAYHAELDRLDVAMLVARRDTPDPRTGRLVYGFVASRVGAGELHINNIGVRASARRRGIGSRLLRAAMSEGAKMGAHAAVLEVRATNLAAQALYRLHGFEVMGRRRSYYRDPTDDALVMVAPLVHSA